MNMKRKSHKAGFTLVEILIVASVMVVLAAILLAVFTRVREKGRSAVCQSNLKQIALAMQQYVQDSDGRFPSSKYVLNRDTPTAKIVHWNDAIMPYIKESRVFQCPKSEFRPEEPDYVYNAQLNDIVWSPNRDPMLNQIVGTHESKILSASTIILNFDTCARLENGLIVNGASIETSCGPRTVATLHSGGANHSYIDGHVKWLSQAKQGELWCSAEQNTIP